MRAKNDHYRLAEIEVRSLLKSPIVKLHDTYCRGTCRHQSAEEHTKTTQLVFPYRGVYVRHVGNDPTVAEANQVLFFNAGEGYKVSHPVEGGDASLTLILDESQLQEAVPRDLLRDGPGVAFRTSRQRIELNLGTFPTPPGNAGLLGLGPLVALWYVVVSTQMLRSRHWAAVRLDSTSNMELSSVASD